MVDGQKVRSEEFRETIVNALAENDGRLHRDQGTQILIDEFDVSETHSREILDEYCRFNDRGWTFSTIHSSFDGDVGSLNQNAGPTTNRSWNGLTVLKDDGHPLIPDQESFKERPLKGTDPDENVTDAQALAHAMADSDFNPLLIGEAGTGKDTLVDYVCTKTNRPRVRVNFGKDVRYADLVGTRMPAETEDDSSGTKVVWEDGLLTRAVKYGYVFVADELNAAPPEATMPLHQITEEGADAELVIREESRVVTPHPQFRFVATMNPPRGGYGGVEQLNDAFKSRFYSIEIDYLQPEREAELLQSRFADEDIDIKEEEITDICSFAGKVRKQYQRGDITTPITTRELIKTLKMRKIMGLKDAAEVVLVGHAKENDKRLLRDQIQKELD
jgi:MoxR-like ATPase